MSLKKDIAQKMIEFLMKKSVRHLERNHKLLKMLENLGIFELKSDFDSIYTHALAEFCIDSPKETVILFASNAVKKAFRDYFYSPDNELSVVVEESFRQFQINGDSPHLKSVYTSAESFLPDIKKLRQSFEHFSLQSSKPAAVKRFNELNRLILRMIDDQQKKSFDFQAERYVLRLRDEFQKEFLENNLYIELNGETRIKKKRGNLQNLNTEASFDDEGKEKLNNTYDIIPHVPLDSFICNWIKEKGQSLMIILGAYGTGKTTFCRYIAHQFAKNALKNPNNRLPLYFQLHNFEKNIESFIVNELSKAGINDIDYSNFLKRMGNGEFILILDGFDEMTQNIDSDEKRKNFDKIKKILTHSPAGKIILTTREEYFQSTADMNAVFNTKDNLDCRCVYLSPFDDIQIQQFLKTHTKNPYYYFEQIKKTFELYDLAKRPVLIKLIVDYLPEVIKEEGGSRIINASDLYKNCIEKELRRKSRDINFIIPDKYRMEILQTLAVWMFLKDEITFDFFLIDNELNLRQYFETSTPWKFEKQLNEFLTFTFLIRERDNKYRISHKSFRDFLTAKSFVEEINSGKVEYFPNVRTSKEVNQFILEQKPDTDKLLKLILTSRRLSESNQWQGTNSANILLKINRDMLKNCDLSGCQLPFVDFWGCDLSGSNFQHANLSNCYFNNKTLLSANLKKVNASKSSLDLSTEKLTDLTPIKDLKQLTVLNLNENLISDISPLKELKMLTELYLYKNHITDISPLSGLRQLIRLDLENNRITDLTPLTELKQLSELYIYGNPIPKSQIQALREALPELKIS